MRKLRLTWTERKTLIRAMVEDLQAHAHTDPRAYLIASVEQNLHGVTDRRAIEAMYTLAAAIEMIAFPNSEITI